MNSFYHDLYQRLRTPQEDDDLYHRPEPQRIYGEIPNQELVFTLGDTVARDVFLDWGSTPEVVLHQPEPGVLYYLVCDNQANPHEGTFLKEAQSSLSLPGQTFTQDIELGIQAVKLTSGIAVMLHHRIQVKVGPAPTLELKLEKEAVPYQGHNILKAPHAQPGVLYEVEIRPLDSSPRRTLTPATAAQMREGIPLHDLAIDADIQITASREVMTQNLQKKTIVHHFPRVIKVRPNHLVGLQTQTLISPNDRQVQFQLKGEQQIRYELVESTVTDPEQVEPAQVLGAFDPQGQYTLAVGANDHQDRSFHILASSDSGLKTLLQAEQDGQLRPLRAELELILSSDFRVEISPQGIVPYGTEVDVSLHISETAVFSHIQAADLTIELESAQDTQAFVPQTTQPGKVYPWKSPSLSVDTSFSLVVKAGTETILRLPQTVRVAPNPSFGVTVIQPTVLHGATIQFALTEEQTRTSYFLLLIEGLSPTQLLDPAKLKDQIAPNRLWEFEDGVLQLDSTQIGNPGRHQFRIVAQSRRDQNTSAVYWQDAEGKQDILVELVNKEVFQLGPIPVLEHGDRTHLQFQADPLLDQQFQLLPPEDLVIRILLGGKETVLAYTDFRTEGFQSEALTEDTTLSLFIQHKTDPQRFQFAVAKGLPIELLPRIQELGLTVSHTHLVTGNRALVQLNQPQTGVHYRLERLTGPKYTVDFGDGPVQTSPMGTEAQSYQIVARASNGHEQVLPETITVHPVLLAQITAVFPEGVMGWGSQANLQFQYPGPERLATHGISVVLLYTGIPETRQQEVVFTDQQASHLSPVLEGNTVTVQWGLQQVAVGGTNAYTHWHAAPQTLTIGPNPKVGFALDSSSLLGLAGQQLPIRLDNPDPDTRYFLLDSTLLPDPSTPPLGPDPSLAALTGLPFVGSPLQLSYTFPAMGQLSYYLLAERNGQRILATNNQQTAHAQLTVEVLEAEAVDLQYPRVADFGKSVKLTLPATSKVRQLSAETWLSWEATGSSKQSIKVLKGKAGLESPVVLSNSQFQLHFFATQNATSPLLSMQLETINTGPKYDLDCKKHTFERPLHLGMQIGGLSNFQADSTYSLVNITGLGDPPAVPSEVPQEVLAQAIALNEDQTFTLPSHYLQEAITYRFKILVERNDNRIFAVLNRPDGQKKDHLEVEVLAAATYDFVNLPAEQLPFASEISLSLTNNQQGVIPYLTTEKGYTVHCKLKSGRHTTTSLSDFLAAGISSPPIFHADELGVEIQGPENIVISLLQAYQVAVQIAVSPPSQRILQATQAHFEITDAKAIAHQDQLAFYLLSSKINFATLGSINNLPQFTMKEGKLTVNSGIISEPSEFEIWVKEPEGSMQMVETSADKLAVKLIRAENFDWRPHHPIPLGTKKSISAALADEAPFTMEELIAEGHQLAFTLGETEVKAKSGTEAWKSELIPIQQDIDIDLKSGQHLLPQVAKIRAGSRPLERGESLQIDFSKGKKSIPVMLDGFSISFWTFIEKGQTGTFTLFRVPHPNPAKPKFKDHIRIELIVPKDPDGDAEIKVVWGQKKTDPEVDWIESALDHGNFEGKWAHWTFVRTPTLDRGLFYFKAFINDIALVKRRRPSTGLLHPVETLGSAQIGEGWKGQVAELRIWDKDLTQGSEIVTESQQKGRLSGQEAGLLGYWPLSEGVEQQIHPDRSSYGNDAHFIQPTIVTEEM